MKREKDLIQVIANHVTKPIIKTVGITVAINSIAADGYKTGSANIPVPAGYRPVGIISMGPSVSGAVPVRYQISGTTLTVGVRNVTGVTVNQSLVVGVLCALKELGGVLRRSIFKACSHRKVVAA